MIDLHLSLRRQRQMSIRERFSDNNKLTSITVGGVFLYRNGIKLTATPFELEDFAVSVATDHLSVEQISTWLQAHSA